MKQNPETSSVAENLPRARLQFQDAVIDRVNLNGSELEVVFSSIPEVQVKDPFGFDFEVSGERACQITIQNPQYDLLPRAGTVTDGHIALGELCYISLFPPDLSLDCDCFLMIEQGDPESDDTESETFMIVGSSMTVKAVGNNK